MAIFNPYSLSRIFLLIIFWYNFKKVQAGKYKTLSDLRADIFIFVENIKICYKEAMIKAATELLKSIDDEIISISTCTSCYSLAYHHPLESFTMPCLKPHLLIWARAPNWPYYPAKLMKICDNDENMVNVRFFGDHTVYDVAAKECYLYSKEHPVQPANFQKDDQVFQAAITVSYIYSCSNFKFKKWRTKMNYNL